MRRIPTGLVIVLVIIIGLAIIILIARPVVVLPPFTVALAENDPLSGYLRLLNIDQLDVTLKTNGQVSLAGDGQKLASMSYDLNSLKNSADLAANLMLPPIVGPMAIGVFLLTFTIFPRLVWSVLVAGLSTYYLVPLEITLRLIRG